MAIFLGAWWIPVVLYIALAFGLVRWIGKKYIVGDKRTRRLLIQFLTCFTGAMVLLAITGQWSLVFTSTVIVWFIGLANGIACFYNWKAQDLSMGKTSVFTIWDDVIAMSLSYFVLSEGRFINGWTGCGIAVSLLALILFAQHAYRHRKKDSALPMECFVYIAIYSVIWGVAMFSERYFSAEYIPVAPFLVAWYGGSVISALGLRLFMHEQDPKQHGDLSLRDIGFTIVYSLLTISCFGVAYWSYRAPQVIVQPIYLVAEAIVPVLVASWFFSDHKGEKFDTAEKAFLGLAAVAVVLIFIGFQ